MVDVDASGTLNYEEFERLYDVINRSAQQREAAKVAEAEAKLAEAEKATKLMKSQRKNSKLRKMVAILGAAFCLMLIGNAGLTLAMVWFAKDTQVSASGIMTIKDSTEPVRVGSADFTVDQSAESLTTNDGHALKVAQAEVASPLNSRLPDSAWKEVRFLHFTNSKGGSIHLTVTAWSNEPLELLIPRTQPAAQGPESSHHAAGRASLADRRSTTRSSACTRRWAKSSLTGRS